MDIAGSIIDHILKPGSSLTLIPLINIALLFLFCVLLFVFYQTDIAVIHIFVMGTLGVGLLLSVNWYDYGKIFWHFTYCAMYCNIGFITSIRKP